MMKLSVTQLAGDVFLGVVDSFQLLFIQFLQRDQVSFGHRRGIDPVRGTHVVFEHVHLAEIVSAAYAAIVFNLVRGVDEFRLTVFIVGASSAATIESVHVRLIDIVLVWIKRRGTRRG